MKHPRPGLSFFAANLAKPPGERASAEGRLLWGGNPVTDANG